jgi:GntR family transcriptional repressor for pyruvate dehydrogenase complex
MLHRHIEDNITSLFASGPVAGELLEQHMAVCRAIVARDPEAARRAAEAHIDFVASTMAQFKDEKERTERARRRMAGA